MFKLVVLSALLAVAVAAPRPGLVSHAVAYSAPVVSHSVVPSAVSHQSRVDVHSQPIVATTYTQSVVPAVHTYAAAPVAVHAVHAAPAVHAVHAVHAVPVAHAYAAHTPVVAHHGVVAAHHGIVSAHHGLVAAPVAYAHHY